MTAYFWFRRDLRLEDNRGFYEALASGNPVQGLFIFDTTILDGLPKDDHRVSFIYDELKKIDTELRSYGSSLRIIKGEPIEIFKQILEDEGELVTVYTNRDYEPYARKRDGAVQQILNHKGVEFRTFNDHLIFEPGEIVKPDGSSYVVYTPFGKRWQAKLSTASEALKRCPSESLLKNLSPSHYPFPSLENLGFIQDSRRVLPTNVTLDFIEHYGLHRDFPSDLAGTSHLGPHLRFGTISIRTVVSQALQSSDPTFLQELIWREFFAHVLWYYPHTINHAFRERYDAITWRNDLDEFKKWKEGTTGYPLVDAGMRELAQTGYLHNRVRMVVASFLTKHLLIDWRWGERYFAEQLLDYELASNVGNWQWVAGTGTDAAPYFRIFNPEEQMKKFDPHGDYVRRWVPEFGGVGYPLPMVDHQEARHRCLQAYQTAIEYQD